MSPAFKSKSKDNKSRKDVQKGPAKPALSINGNSNFTANAYNPLLGTFQVLDSVASISSDSPIHNGRFRSIDEGDITGVESDSVSNNGSWSGESEDHKDKSLHSSVRQETIPGADQDRREKIRQKNERKHQRQKEKRVLELHEKCNSYLMSRKLEALTQQLVAMGISEEHATTALILNEGKVEDSVHWLFDRSEEEIETESTLSTVNLKIDITEELARIIDMEMRYKCTRQEVERAVVAAEGDLVKAEEAIKASHKQEQTSVPIKQGESSDSEAMKPQAKPIPAPVLRHERAFNYTKSLPVMGNSLQSPNKSVPIVQKLEPKLEWAKPQQSPSMADKNKSNTGKIIPSATHPFAPSVKLEARHVTDGNDFKSPQSSQLKQVPASSTITSLPRGTSSSWRPVTNNDIMYSDKLTPPYVSSAQSPNQLYPHLQFQQSQRFGNNLTDSSMANHGGNGFVTRNSVYPDAAASPEHWSHGRSTTHYDYSSIDWSLDRSLWPRSELNACCWYGSTLKPMDKTFMPDAKNNFNCYSLEASVEPRGRNGGIAMRGQGGVVSGETSTASSWDWSSPFEGKDMFGISREYHVSSSSSSL